MNKDITTIAELVNEFYRIDRHDKVLINLLFDLRHAEAVDMSYLLDMTVNQFEDRFNIYLNYDGK